MDPYTTEQIVERVTTFVIGAGAMRSTIAKLCALLGHQVTLFDALENTLKKGLQDIEFSLKKMENKSTLPETAANVLFQLKAASTFVSRRIYHYLSWWPGFGYRLPEEGR